MLLGSIQVCRERISRLEMEDICRALQKHKVRLLALRECQTGDDEFEKLLTSVSSCRSILHLNLNLGLVNSVKRAKIVRNCLVKNRSLSAFFVHGSPLGDGGARSILKGVTLHPNIISLDLGDCQLSDKSIPPIADLLPPNGAKRGLKELTLTANNDISAEGWTHLFTAISACSSLRTLNIDYNNIGDYGVGCLAVALASNHSLQLVDLEGCGITDFGGKVFLNLIRNYPVSVKQLILTENSISSTITEEINCRLQGVQDVSLSENSTQGTSGERGSNSSHTSTVSFEDLPYKSPNRRNLNIVIREPAATRKVLTASNMVTIPEHSTSVTERDMHHLSEDSE